MNRHAWKMIGKELLSLLTLSSFVVGIAVLPMFFWRAGFRHPLWVRATIVASLFAVVGVLRCLLPGPARLAMTPGLALDGCPSVPIQDGNGFGFVPTVSVRLDDANKQTLALEEVYPAAVILYMQTAAEYQACCRQAYRLATERLKARANGVANCAVILDLDETVFDNSEFHARLHRHQLVYTDALWEDWEKNHADDVGLIPGARGFIELAERMGVTVLFISNRLEKYRSTVVAILNRLGLNTQNIDRRLLLKRGSSDKTARRRQMERDYHVVLCVGDSLRDFSEEFAASTVDPDDEPAQKRAIAQRQVQAAKHRARWGDDWILLPNPLYGEWQRLLEYRPVRHEKLAFQGAMGRCS